MQSSPRHGWRLRKVNVYVASTLWPKIHVNSQLCPNFLSLFQTVLVTFILHVQLMLHSDVLHSQRFRKLSQLSVQSTNIKPLFLRIHVAQCGMQRFYKTVWKKQTPAVCGSHLACSLCFSFVGSCFSPSNWEFWHSVSEIAQCRWHLLMLIWLNADLNKQLIQKEFADV